MFIILCAIVYLFIKLEKTQNKIKELEPDIEDYIDFQHKLTLIWSNINNITEYFRLRSKHRSENIYIMIMDKEEEELIDKDALLQRQESEMEKLMSKKESPDYDFPGK